MRRNQQLFFIFLSFFILPFQGIAGTPTDTVKNTTDNALHFMKSDTFEANNLDQQEQLRGIIESGFALQEMAKRSLGRNWKKFKKPQQKEYTKLFARLIGNSYLQKISAYTDEIIEYLGEKKDEEYAEVKTQLKTDYSEPIALAYRLKKIKKKWMVFDVKIEGVSLVNHYRGTFNRIIKRKGAETLLKKLRAKVKSQEKTARSKMARAHKKSSPKRSLGKIADEATHSIVNILSKSKAK